MDDENKVLSDSSNGSAHPEQFLLETKQWMRETKIEGKYSSRKLYRKLKEFANASCAQWENEGMDQYTCSSATQESAITAFEELRNKLPIRDRNRLPAELPEAFRRRLCANLYKSSEP